MSDDKWEPEFKEVLEKTRKKSVEKLLAEGKRIYDKFENIKLPQPYEDMVNNAIFNVPDLNICEIFRQWNMAYSKYHAPTMYCNDSMEIDISFNSAELCINEGFDQLRRFLVKGSGVDLEKFGKAYPYILGAAIKTKFWYLQTGGGNLPSHAKLDYLKRICCSTTTIICKDGTSTVEKNMDEQCAKHIEDFINIMHDHHYYNCSFNDIPVDEKKTNFTIDYTHCVNLDNCNCK